MCIISIAHYRITRSYKLKRYIISLMKSHQCAARRSKVCRGIIKPACLEIVRLMLGKKEVEEIIKVSLSAETIKRRIDDNMSSNILETLIKKLKTCGYFSLQIDETTDITKKAQLLSVVRFVNGYSIREEHFVLRRTSRANYWPGDI